MDYNELKNLMRNYLGDLVDSKEFEYLFVDCEYSTHLQKCMGLIEKYDAMIDYIEEYLKIYGDVNEINENGHTALHTLFYQRLKNIKRIIEILINAGIDVNIQDKDEDTALHYLCSEWNVEKEGLISKSKNSCFMGRKLKGVVLYTIIAGELVFENTNFH